MIVELIQAPTSQAACQEGGQLNSAPAPKHLLVIGKAKSHVAAALHLAARIGRFAAVTRPIAAPAGKHSAESSLPTPRSEEKELIQ
jgi:hypothetical protein